MDRLAELLAKANIKETTFILWSTRHRITLATPTLANRHRAGAKQMSLECLSITKHYIPRIYSWYSQNVDNFDLETTNHVGNLRFNLENNLHRLSLIIHRISC